MARRRSNARLVKQHRCYTIAETADCLGVATGTIRRWVKQGLPVMAGQKPYLIIGSELRQFLERQAPRKQRCAPHEFFCFRCRAPRAAAGDMIDYVPRNDRTGRLSAICEVCGTLMHKSYSAASLPDLMAIATVSFPKGRPHLIEKAKPCSHDHFGKEPEA